MSPPPGADLGLIGKEKGIISADEYAQWSRKEALRKHVIKVDDFPRDFARAALAAALGEETVKMKAA